LLAPEHHRQLDAPTYVVANAKSQVATQLIGCQMSSSLNCIHVIISLNLHLKGTETTDALMRLISDTFAPPQGMVNKLELNEPFVGLWISSVAASGSAVAPPTPAPWPPGQTAPGFTPIRYDQDDDLYDDLYVAPTDGDINGDDDDLFDDDDDDDLLGDDLLDDDDLYDDDGDDDLLDDDDLYDDDGDDDDGL
jgi:hypothetical protein